MNYILEPKVGADAHELRQLRQPEQGGRRRTSTRTSSNNPLIYPPADVLAKLPFQKDIGDAELEYSDRWTEVKIGLSVTRRRNTGRAFGRSDGA